MEKSSYLCQPITSGWCSESLAKRLGEILFGSSVPMYEEDPDIFRINEKRKNVRVVPKAKGFNDKPEWLVHSDQPLSTATCHFLSEAIGPFVSFDEGDTLHLYKW